ncbi:MAG TPA: hypothetical protein VFS24_05580 [Steroidobacteraceae bacterium]|nr:hypothetical protein [Steroidobacteraceae bacterium]
MRAIAAMLGACLLSACSGNGKGLDENGRPVQQTSNDELTATFDSIQQHVFTPICTACHTGSTAPLGLRLDEGVSYAMLVNVASVEDPTLKRIDPGNPDASYLIHKIEGTASVGGRMPLGGSPLPPATIAVIRQWISDGAQPPAGVAPQRLSKLLPAWPPQDSQIKAPRELIVTANDALDTTTLQNSIELVRAGGDEGFNDGNEQIIPVDAQVITANPTVISITPRTPWVADLYELHINAAGSVQITDLSGRVVDGNDDAVAGGEFVLRFAVEE